MRKARVAECSSYACQWRDEVGEKVVLTARRQRAELLTAQVHVRLPSKEPAILSRLSVLDIESVLKNEDQCRALQGAGKGNRGKERFRVCSKVSASTAASLQAKHISLKKVHCGPQITRPGAAESTGIRRGTLHAEH
jgi:hypothetical protein